MEGETEIDEMCYVRLYIRGQPVNRCFDGKIVRLHIM